MPAPDPVQQVLQRKAFRVRKAHPDDKRREGSQLLRLLIRQLESKAAQHGVDSGQRQAD
ncbi:hypothetical protein [Vogesella oryzae]|uniref:hypothetical protein n=1 Tax=Vogesella oryzae TaxID=1735285 RepID=UPI001581D810|nr:hypothetical protein [Vogesella oryzae]